MGGIDVAEPFDADNGSRLVDRHGLDGVAEPYVDAGTDGQLDEGGIELQPRRHRGIDPGAGRQGHLERAPRRGAQQSTVDDAEVGHGRRVEAKQFELAEGEGRQAVPAALVAGKLGLVDEQHVTAGAAELDRRGHPGGTSANDERVDQRGNCDVSRSTSNGAGRWIVSPNGTVTTRR